MSSQCNNGDVGLSWMWFCIMECWYEMEMMEKT